MPSGREIVTLQFGHYSNFIGAHWWNIQESGFVYNAKTPSEIDHDVLYREGLTNKREVTFTPRALLVDLKGSLGPLSREGDLYEPPYPPSPEQAPWPLEKVQLIRGESPPKNEYLRDLEQEAAAMEQDMVESKVPKVYNLDNSVHVWADFLRQRYHPRTVHLIGDYEHKSETRPFDMFSQGTAVWNNEKFGESFLDDIRHLVEECDNMQGFHVLLDATDGFAGLGCAAVQYLGDEYPRKSSLVFPTILPQSDISRALGNMRVMNLTLSFTSLMEHSALFSPLSTGCSGWRDSGLSRDFPHLSYNGLLPYHSSAVLAAALDTVTLGHRLRGGDRMSDLCDSMSRLGRRAVAASLALPFSMARNSFLLETLEHWEGPLWQSLTPNCCLDDDRIWVQSVALRGVSQLRLRNPQVDSSQRRDANPAYSCSTVREMLSLFLSCCSYATYSHVNAATTPVKVLPPFPQIFSQRVGLDGSVNDTTRFPNTGVYCVPALAGLHSSRSVGAMVASLRAEAGRLSLGRLHQARQDGLEEDEWLETLDRIQALAECYHEEFDV